LNRRRYNEEIVKHKVESINRIRKEIEELTEKFNQSKSELIRQNKSETGSSSGQEKQAE
jgi:FtsZ-binding cell division protein ZapB